ncbi:MAG: hypothetical protein ACLT98_08615 [Eggerthellaceae bacterium]
MTAASKARFEQDSRRDIASACDAALVVISVRSPAASRHVPDRLAAADGTMRACGAPAGGALRRLLQPCVSTTAWNML